jgi:hypothetical protein
MQGISRLRGRQSRAAALHARLAWPCLRPLESTIIIILLLARTRGFWSAGIRCDRGESRHLSITRDTTAMEATTVRAIGPLRRANLLLYWRNDQLPGWAEDTEAKPEHPRWKARAGRRRVYMLRTFAVTLLLAVLIIMFRSAPGAPAQPGHVESMRLQGRATDVARILRSSTQYTPAQQPLREHAVTFEPGEDFLEDPPITPEGADAGSKSRQSTQLEAPDDAAQPANGTSSPERKPTPAVVRDHSLSPVDRAPLLPAIVFIPFEDAVADETLEGWEDDWFSEVNYDESQSGLLQEPSIDFIYLCECGIGCARRRLTQ